MLAVESTNFKAFPGEVFPVFTYMHTSGTPQTNNLFDKSESVPTFVYNHTRQVLRFRRSHYGFLETLKTTALVGKDNGFTLGWGCNLFGNHLIMFGLIIDELMVLSQYR